MPENTLHESSAKESRWLGLLLKTNLLVQGRQYRLNDFVVEYFLSFSITVLQLELTTLVSAAEIKFCEVIKGTFGRRGWNVGPFGSPFELHRIVVSNVD